MSHPIIDAILRALGGNATVQVINSEPEYTPDNVIPAFFEHIQGQAGKGRLNAQDLDLASEMSLCAADLALMGETDVGTLAARALLDTDDEYTIASNPSYRLCADAYMAALIRLSMPDNPDNDQRCHAFLEAAMILEEAITTLSVEDASIN
jgi:hypothetical protein